MVRLGPTKEMACAYFYDNSDHLDILRDQVREALDKKAGVSSSLVRGMPVADHLRAVNTFILNYLDNTSAQLEDWEDLRLRSFYEGVAGKLRAHLSALAVNEDGNEATSGSTPLVETQSP